ncbi:MAG: urea carboxylase-associated family protein [Actinomycetota bacterium]
MVADPRGARWTENSDRGSCRCRRGGPGGDAPRGEPVRRRGRGGGQVVDLFAFSSADVAEYASAEHTRMQVNRLFPAVGEAFVTNRRRPILVLESDDSPGIHDMLCAACDPIRYRLLGDDVHASCQDNLLRVMAELGHPHVEVPQPINLFMDVGVQPDGSLTWGPSPAKAGDRVTLRAAIDCIVVASACPQDRNAINHFRPTSIGISLLAD